MCSRVRGFGGGGDTQVKTSHIVQSDIVGYKPYKSGSCGMSLLPFTDWAQNAHSDPFEQSKNAHWVPSL